MRFKFHWDTAQYKIVSSHAVLVTCYKSCTNSSGAGIGRLIAMNT
jgi:hypothetical protein